VLAKILPRHAMPIAAFVELAKRDYVNVALRDFAIPGRAGALVKATGTITAGSLVGETAELVDEGED
jgi:hypothetical protein